MLVLVTRPRAQAEATAAALRGMGHEALVEPVLEILPLPPPTVRADGVAAVVLTSANAVPLMPEVLKTMPVFAVGRATAAAARLAGCGDVRAAAEDGRALAALVRESVRPGDGRVVLHLAAEEVREGLEEGLREAGLAYRRAAVYRTVPTPGLSAAAREALAGDRVGAALVFSPRSAGVLVGHLGAAGLAERVGGVVAACLSEAVADGLRALPWREIRVAAARDQSALLAVLADRIVE